MKVVRTVLCVGLCCFLSQMLHAQVKRASSIPVHQSKNDGVKTVGLEEAIYIPSPFAEDGQMTASGHFSIDGVHPYRATGQELATKHLKPIGESNSGKQIVVESFTLLVDDEIYERIFGIVDRESFQITGGELKSARLATPKVELQQKSAAVASETILKGSPTAFGPISIDQFDRIQMMVKGTEQSNIIQAPTMMMFDNQQGVVSDASLRPFVVGVEPRDDGKGGINQVPIIQVIEDGAIARHRARVTEQGIQLESSIILNQIEEVGEYHFESGVSPVTIQVPKCNCKQLACSMELKEGQYMLIDPNFERAYEVRTESRFLMFKRSGIKRSSRKMLYLVKAVAVESSR